MTTLLPINTTGRNKQEIVENAETTYLKGVIIDEIVHDESCRCSACFQRYLDKVVEMGNQALEEVQ